MIRTVRLLAELRSHLARWRDQGARIAFVPTMGGLHAGHVSLIELARSHADRVVSTVFVNPTQFGPHEDFDAYPRDAERDAEMLANAGCDLLFLPSIETMYPFGIDQAVKMTVPGLSDVLDGKSRPGHFDGVATVVTRFFNMVRPDVAVFGRKDYQQLQIIRHLVRDLAFPVDVVPAVTLREPSGLAMSSRNQYLSASERRVAAEIHSTLLHMREQASIGFPPRGIEAEAITRLQAIGFEVEYAVVRRSDLSVPEQSNEKGLVALIAARLGKTRLIDNLSFDPG